MKSKLLKIEKLNTIFVYENGLIKTLDHTEARANGRKDNRKGKFLKPKTDRYGYQVITLSKNGYRKSFSIHRLVAIAFLPNPYNKPTVNHIDGNKKNNNVKNLEWATQKEQKDHAIKNHLCDKNILALKKANQRKRVIANEQQ